MSPTRQAISGGLIGGRPITEWALEKFAFFSDWSFLYILCILVNGYHIYVLGRYERLQGQRRNDVEPSAGKLVMMDVFQAPRFPEILCIVVGNGLHITCTALVIGSFFDVIFLTSSVPPGISTITCMIFIYSFSASLGAMWLHGCGAPSKKMQRPGYGSH